MFIWSVWAIAYLVVGFFVMALALMIFLARPDRIQNRVLAAMIFANAASAVPTGLRCAALDPVAHRAFVIADMTAWYLVPFLYLAFLGTLRTPLSRPLRRPMGWIAIALAAIAFQVGPRLWPEFFVVALRTSLPSCGWSGGPGASIFFYLYVVVCLYAFLVALSAWRRALAGSARRRQAAYYAVAFGVRDVAIIGLGLYGALIRFTGFTGPGVSTHFWVVNEVLFATLLFYGILRSQLFDIDLKIKWTINRSTLVAVFVGAFFITAQVAQAFLVTEWGWAVGGIVAGVLLLAINPLQRFAGRVADVAMPSVHDTEAYRMDRKREVYHAALEAALEGGAITVRDRRMLAALQDKLGLLARETVQIEQEVLRAREVD